MLATMRRFAHGFIAKTLMGLLVISFAVWGVGDILRTHESGSLAHVGPQNVSAQEFLNQRNAMRQAIAQLSLQGIDQRAIDQEIMRQLIQTRLIRLWLSDADFAVNRPLLATTIQHDRQFHDITGKFDKKMFAKMLSARQMSETTYLIQLSDEVAGKILQSSLNTDDISMPDSLAKLEAATQNQTRDALIITLPLGALDTASITEPLAQSYYEAHKINYLDPERRTLEYVTLDQNDIKALIDASITEEALQERYKARPSVAPNFELARPILVKELQEEAREHVLHDVNSKMEDALAGGSSMGEALAKSGVKSQSKILTRVTATQLAASTDPVLQAVVQKGFALSDGETSGLQGTKDNRYFIVMAKEIVPPSPKPFAEVKNDVRLAMAKENASSKVREQLEKVRTAFAKSPDALKTIDQLHVATRNVSNIRRPKVDPSGKLQAADNSLPAALQQAMFEHAPGDLVGPAVLPDGGAMLAVVTNLHQPQTAGNEKTPELEKRYQAELNNDAVGAQLNHLVQRYPVTINEALFTKVTGAAQ